MEMGIKNKKDNDILEKLFEQIRSERGEVAGIHKEFSAFPEGIKAHFEFYEKIILADNLPLSRCEREYLAVLSSEENSCQYCIEHHKEALNNNDIKLEEKRVSFYKYFVAILSKEPWKGSILKRKALEVGLSDAEYAHAVMVVGYFNMANRLVFGLDIQLEDDFKKTCR